MVKSGVIFLENESKASAYKIEYRPFDLPYEPVLEAPLKIVGEITAWVRQTTDELQKWREKLADNKGEIIN